MHHSPSFSVILSRSLRGLCPVCGEGRLFIRLHRVSRFSEFLLPPKTCISCGFRFARQPGYYFGVVTPTLPILAFLTAVLFSATAYFVFHQDVDSVMRWGAIGGALGLVLFFRTAIAIFVAIDHAVDPPLPGPESGAGQKPC